VDVQMSWILLCQRTPLHFYLFVTGQIVFELALAFLPRLGYPDHPFSNFSATVYPPSLKTLVNWTQEKTRRLTGECVGEPKRAKAA
jgi:hypothetical protein